MLPRVVCMCPIPIPCPFPDRGRYEMFLLYRADRNARDEQPACFATFWSCWQQEYSAVLRFLKKSQHAKCNVCERYKAHLKRSTIPQDRLFWSKHYAGHLLAQYRDREEYYKERAWARHCAAEALGPWRLGPGTLTACLILDAMDQAKFACPRHLAGAKDLQAERRPRLHTIGLICHGHFQAAPAPDQQLGLLRAAALSGAIMYIYVHIYIYNLSCPPSEAGFITDSTVRKDSDLWCEGVAQALQMLAKSCKEKNLPFPSRLVVQCDNASDNKCQHSFKVLMALVASNSGLAKGVTEVVASYLRSGHTHEDIGRGPIPRIL